MSAEAAYEVTAERSGKYWHVRVPAVDRVTQARTLAEVEAMARDLLEVMDVPDAATAALDVRVLVPAEVRERIDRAAELRGEAGRLEDEAAKEWRAAARGLVGELGLTMRDAAQVLGVSAQRVHQLVR